MRTARFIARKQWVICGADDMLIRVYNYNTMEKVAEFEAHQGTRTLLIGFFYPTVCLCDPTTRLQLLRSSAYTCSSSSLAFLFFRLHPLLGRAPDAVVRDLVVRRHVDQAVGLGEELAVRAGVRGPHPLRHAAHLQPQGPQHFRLGLARQDYQGTYSRRLLRHLSPHLCYP